MKQLSTGEDSTLENYRKMTVLFFGEDSKAVAFLDEKAKIATDGMKEEVLADEGQMIYLLTNIHTDKKSK